jgi:MFS superfamily sulfate permease-like transporter
VAELGLDPAAPDRYVDLTRHASAEAPEGIVVLRIESGLFFANADGVEAVIRAAAHRPGTRAVVIDAESVPSIDVSAADMVEGLRDRLEAQDVRLVLAREFGQVDDVLTTAEPGHRALEVYPTVRAAVSSCVDDR